MLYSVIKTSCDHWLYDFPVTNFVGKKAGFPSTKGQLVLSGSSDCSLKLWCSATGEVLVISKFVSCP